MRIQITLKDPDGVYESISGEGIDFNNMPKDLEECLYKFFEYQEYCRIELDTETMTAKVIPNK